MCACATGEDSDLKHATVPLRETHVMDETEEQINTRMQLIVHLLMKGEEPVLQVRKLRCHIFSVLCLRCSHERCVGLADRLH